MFRMTTPHFPAPGDCALLVVSCDPYADLWPPFFALLRRHWPDCPFPVYLGTGENGPPPDGIAVLRSAGGKDWSRCVRDYLDALPQPYVLMMLDDFFLRRTVATGDVLRCLRFAMAQQALQVRLIPRPRPTTHLPEEALVGACAPGSPYRLSTQAAIWDRKKLRDLLVENESIWEFEHNGNRRADAWPDGFYSVWRPVLPYEGWLAHHVVEKGKWLPHEKWFFGRQGIGCDFSRRGTLPARQLLAYHLSQGLDHLLDVFGWKTKKRIKARLRRWLAPLFRQQMARMAGVAPFARPAPPTPRVPGGK